MAYADMEFDPTLDVDSALREWDAATDDPLEVLRLALEKLAEDDRLHSH